MKRLATSILAAIAALAMTGCDDNGNSGEEFEPVIRPVLSVVVEPTNRPQASFAGIIEPRYQTDRAFLVLGRIVARSVDVGDAVKKGQVIARIDPLDYRLAVTSAEADSAAARSRLEEAFAHKNRTEQLTNRKVASQEKLDIAQEAMEAAAAAVRQAEENLVKARERLAYTTLVADIDGVVTGLQAEVGQMASPGKVVLTLAQTNVREAVVDVPEEFARSLGSDIPFEVRLQADPSIATSGTLREIAPEADATTRLKRIKITLGELAESFRLGAMVSVTISEIAAPPTIDVPASAIFERDGKTRVWVVDQDTATVHSVAVVIAARDDRDARISHGLENGARVVVAGANSLAEGQTIKIGKEAGK